MFYIYQNTSPKTSWVFGNSIHDTAPAGTISRKFVSGTTFRFIYTQVSGVTPIGLEVDILTVAKNANGDLYSSVAEFETACDSFFVKAPAGGGGITPEQLALKADKLSTAFTFKANPTENDTDEQEYGIYQQGIDLLARDTPASMREELEAEISSEGYNISSANQTLDIPLNTYTNNRFVLVNVGNYAGNHIVKLPNTNKTTRIFLQVNFGSNTATQLTVKDYNNNTVCVFPNPNDSTVYAWVDVICNNAGSAENWNEHNVIAAKIDTFTTLAQLKTYLGI